MSVKYLDIYKHLKQGKNYKSGKQIEKDFEILINVPGAVLFSTHTLSEKYESIVLYLDNFEEDIRIVLSCASNRVEGRTSVRDDTSFIDYSYLTKYDKHRDCWLGSLYRSFKMETMFPGIPAEIYRMVARYCVCSTEEKVTYYTVSSKKQQDLQFFNHN